MLKIEIKKNWEKPEVGLAEFEAIIEKEGRTYSVIANDEIGALKEATSLLESL